MPLFPDLLSEEDELTLSGCGIIGILLDGRLPFAPILIRQKKEGLFKKAVQQGRKPRGERGVHGGYVEPSEQ
jgi:hypothetical protein